MIVAHSVRNVWLAQTQAWLHDLVRFLPDEVESHVVCPEVCNLDQFPVERLHVRASASRAWKLKDRLRCALAPEQRGTYLDATLDGVRADLLHSHFAPHGWTNLPVAKKRQLPHVTSFYGFDVNRLPSEEPVWRTRYAELFASVSRVLCEGPFMAASIRELGCAPEKLSVHPLGVDLERIPFVSRTWSGSEPLKVLMASAFRPKKGLPLAIEALGRVAPQVELELTLVGGETDAPGSREEGRRIQEALRRTGLLARTRLPGFRPLAELMRMAQEHHVYLAPSLTAPDGDCEGGAPVSLIQMAASGILVIASDHCDIPQVVRDGETGFLAAEGQLDSLEERIRTALEARDGWERIVTAGREHIERGFDCRRQGRHLATIYQSCLTG